MFDIYGNIIIRSILLMYVTAKEIRSKIDATPKVGDILGENKHQLLNRIVNVHYVTNLQQYYHHCCFKGKS